MIGTDSVGQRVRVEFGNGFNCVGTVERVYFDTQGRRTALIEDSIGQERAVRLARPAISVTVLDESGGGSA